MKIMDTDVVAQTSTDTMALKLRYDLTLFSMSLVTLEADLQ